jgi:hypothetical protein
MDDPNQPQRDEIRMYVYTQRIRTYSNAQHVFLQEKRKF